MKNMKINPRTKYTLYEILKYKLLLKFDGKPYKLNSNRGNDNAKRRIVNAGAKKGRTLHGMAYQVPGSLINKLNKEYARTSKKIQRKKR